MSPQSSHLLVVDDDPVNRDVLRRRLERRGYSVSEAPDGLSALGLIGEHAFDLVLLDVMMPGMNGIEVLQQIRQTHPVTELPVIMATALTDSGDMVKALEMGASDYVTKPLDFPVVVARIERQLSLRSTASSPIDRTDAPTASHIATQAGEEPLSDVPPFPNAESLLGQVIGERYRLDKILGSGACGVVYAARHLGIDQPVAVKVLASGIRTSKRAVSRFRREAIAACRVRHPHAVRVLDAGVDPRSIPFLVMELLEGRNLSAAMKQRKRFPAARAVELVLPICDMLAATHAEGLIHRDLKPANVFLHRERGKEVVKVVDFGLAKFAGELEAADGPLTRTGQVLGTPLYMAPERLNNKPYDGRADVYSLGMIFYELLAGRPPFLPEKGNLMGLVLQQLHELPASLRTLDLDVPEAVDAAALRALEKDPQKRPQAAALGRMLAVAVGIPISADEFPSLAV